MSNEIRDNRLAFELQEMKRLRRDSSLIDFKPNDEDLPDQYYVEFRCLGLALKNYPPVDHHVVHIYLPADYPRVPPVIRFKTLIFHPNIRAMVDDEKEFVRLLEAVGGVENLRRLYAEDERIRDLLDARVCLDVLSLNWTPAYSLYDICLELGTMIQYQRFNVDDPLNKEAADWAKWAKTQPGLLPIDTRDLRDRLQFEFSDSTDKVTTGQSGIRILKVEKIST